MLIQGLILKPTHFDAIEKSINLNSKTPEPKISKNAPAQTMNGRIQLDILTL